MYLSNVSEANVARAQEGRHKIVLEAAQLEADSVVEKSHSYLV